MPSIEEITAAVIAALGATDDAPTDTQATAKAGARTTQTPKQKAAATRAKAKAIGNLDPVRLAYEDEPVRFEITPVSRDASKNFPLMKNGARVHAFVGDKAIPEKSITREVAQAFADHGAEIVKAIEVVEKRARVGHYLPDESA